MLDSEDDQGGEDYGEEDCSCYYYQYLLGLLLRCVGGNERGD